MGTARIPGVIHHVQADMDDEEFVATGKSPFVVGEFDNCNVTNAKLFLNKKHCVRARVCKWERKTSVSFYEYMYYTSINVFPMLNVNSYIYCINKGRIYI